jgi:hypothetical protein
VANWHEPAAGTWTVTLANMPKAAGQWMLFEMILHTVDIA